MSYWKNVFSVLICIFYVRILIGKERKVKGLWVFLVVVMRMIICFFFCVILNNMLYNNIEEKDFIVVILI